MTFLQALRQIIGRQVQIVAGSAVYAGILTQVSSGSIVITTAPQYGPPEQQSIAVGSISHVRVFSF